MSRLIRTELLKVGTTRLWWALLLGAVAFIVLNAGLTGLMSGEQGTPGLDTDEAVRNVWGSAGTAYIFALIMGVLLMCGEFRHQTVTTTFLATPHRARVVAAKLVAAVVVGVGYGVVACAVTAAVAVPVLAARDATGQADVAAILAGAVLGTVLYAVAGVGVGALVRNQIAAIVGALVWVLIIETLLVVFLPDIGKWLPGGAANAVLQASVPGGGSLLEPWAGALLFTAYGLVLAAVGARFTVRRDIT